MGLLSIEGAHALDGKLANFQGLYDAGYRMIGLHHFFDNKLGSSLHCVSGCRLSLLGRQALAEMEKRNIIVDQAHSSKSVVDEVLKLVKRSLMISHTGLQGTCDSPRNISDALMKRIADKGGMIGIGFWKPQSVIILWRASPKRSDTPSTSLEKTMWRWALTLMAAFEPGSMFQSWPS